MSTVSAPSPDSSDGLSGKKDGFWASSAGVKLAVALIGAASGVAVAFITTKGTLNASSSQVTSLSTDVQTAQSALDKIKAERAAIAPPVGTVMAYSGFWSPNVESGLKAAGWLKCDGQELPRAQYQELYDAIDRVWGGDSSPDMFRVPDMRGYFLRGVDGGAGVDPEAKDRKESHAGGYSGDKVGSSQPDALKSHVHRVPFAAGPFPVTPNKDGHQVINYTAADGISSAQNTTPPKKPGTVEDDSGPETRPKNVAVYWLIRAKP